MKNNRSIKKLMMQISLVFVFILMTRYSTAQPNAIGQIWSCYQKVNLESGKQIKLWSLEGQPTISLYAGSTGTTFHYFTIQQYNVSAGTYQFLNFPPSAGWPYVWVTDPNTGMSVRAYQNDFSTFYSTILLPTTQSLIITLYAKHESPSGVVTYDVSYQDISIDFIESTEAFSVQPINQSCFTYENFQIKNDLVKLEGFCGTLGDYQLKLSPSADGNNMGLSEDFSREIDVISGSVGSTPINIPIDTNQCTDPNYLCQSSSPCGCINFKFEFTVLPCQETSYCTNVPTVSIPIRICCRCGIPDDSDFPSMGRNTANTALTGQNNELTIFPNPNHSGKLQVNAPNSIKDIKIYAVDGRLVKSLSLKEQKQSKVSVDISGLKPGMYQVQVRDQANTLSNQKLVIQ